MIFVANFLMDQNKLSEQHTSNESTSIKRVSKKCKTKIRRSVVTETMIGKHNDKRSRTNTNVY